MQIPRLRTLSVGLALALGTAAPVAAARQEPPGLAFASAERCALCHSESPRATAMRDSSGASVAPHGLWQATMMAGSARDPLFHAVLSAEVATFPALRETLETKCLRCHAPVLSATPEGTLGAPASLEELADEAAMSAIAREGVTCLVCHQVLPDGLGEQASFSGSPRLTLERTAFGPHASPFTRPMRMHSGFTPAEGGQVLRAGLCGSCHTLFTPVHDADGNALGAHFGEQTPYLEWRSSSFGDGELTCQACHMPQTGVDGQRIRTRIARNPGGRDFPPVREREPFGRHVLAGGNTLVPALLAALARAGDDPVPAPAHQAKAAAAREVLTHAATVRVTAGQRDEASLRFEVEVDNLCGHKLPTGHPARRAWLRVRVLDGDGALLFASGEHDAHGRLIDGRGEVLAAERAGGPQWPHRGRVSLPDQVQVYEAVMADAQGAPTYRLLAGAAWAKDDRILPPGFAPSEEDAPHVAPHGTAADPDFVPGSDRVRFELGVPAGARDLRVEVELLYQPLGARWLDELAQVDTPQVRALLAQLQGVPLPTERIARASWTLER
jgi:hypothetical protein